MHLTFVGNDSEDSQESKQTNEQKTIKWGKLWMLPYDRKNITEYLRRETKLTSSIALYVFDQVKFNQSWGLLATCQITRVDLILLRCQLVKKDT